MLEGDHHVADGDRQRAPGAALAGDHGDDRRPEPAHQGDRASDRLGDPALLGFRAGMGAGHVDEGDDRHPQPFGQLHQSHRLAVPLRVGHPEVAPDVLLRLGALLLADDDDPPAVDPGQPGDHRRVVAEEAVAVELDELVGDVAEELEHPRATQVPGELDGRPDRSRRIGVTGRSGRRRGLPIAARLGPVAAAATEDPVNHGRAPRPWTRTRRRIRRPTARRRCRPPG